MTHVVREGGEWVGHTDPPLLKEWGTGPEHRVQPDPLQLPVLWSKPESTLLLLDDTLLVWVLLRRGSRTRVLVCVYLSVCESSSEPRFGSVECGVPSEGGLEGESSRSDGNWMSGPSYSRFEPVKGEQWVPPNRVPGKRLLL